MDARTRLGWVRLYERVGNAGIVCRRCGIARPTLRKWWRRYRAEGGAGLETRSHRPHRSPNRNLWTTPALQGEPRYDSAAVCGNLSGVTCGAVAPRHHGNPRTPGLINVPAPRAVATCQTSGASVPPSVHRSRSSSQTVPERSGRRGPRRGRSTPVERQGSVCSRPPASARSRRSARACGRAPPPARCGAAGVPPPRATGRRSGSPR